MIESLYDLLDHFHHFRDSRFDRRGQFHSDLADVFGRDNDQLYVRQLLRQYHGFDHVAKADFMRTHQGRKVRRIAGTDQADRSRRIVVERCVDMMIRL